MRENFERIMDEIFKHEGGYVDHPRDPGGATNMGITFATLRAYRGKAITKADVKALTKAEAREIYRKNYWNKVSGDDLPSGVDLCTMDGAVNSGPSRGVRWLQRAVGANADGQIGPKTIAAADEAPLAQTINRMCDDRMNFLRGLGTWSTFGTGWTRRVTSVRKVALELAKLPTYTPPEPIVEPALPFDPPLPPIDSKFTLADYAAMLREIADGLEKAK
jgi:lysozyme family protein